MRAARDSCIKALKDAGGGYGVPYGVVVVNEGLQALTGIGVPETSAGELSRGVKFCWMPLHKSVHGTRNDQGPIQVKTDRSDGIRVSGKDFKRFTWCFPSDTTVRSTASESTSRDVPYPNRLIKTARGKKIGLVIKVDAKHKVCVPLQNLNR